MLSRIDTDDLRVLAARASASGQMYVDNEASVPVSELLGKSSVAANHLSRLCMMVFQGKSQMRTACRDLDFLAYGQEVTKLGPQIMRAFIKAVGDRDAGNLEDTGKSDS